MYEIFAKIGKIIYIMADSSKFDLSYDCFDFLQNDPWLCEPDKPTFKIPHEMTNDLNDPWLCEPYKPTFKISDVMIDVLNDPWLCGVNPNANLSLGIISAKKFEATVTSKDFKQLTASEDFEQFINSEYFKQLATSEYFERLTNGVDVEQLITSEDFELSTTSKGFEQSATSKGFEQSTASKDQNNKPKVVVQKIEVDINSIEILRNEYERGKRVKPSTHKDLLHDVSKRKFGMDCQSSENEPSDLRKKSTMINEERPSSCTSRSSTKTVMKLKDFAMIRFNIESSLPWELYDLSEVLFLRHVKDSEIHEQILEFSNFSFEQYSPEYGQRHAILQLMNLDNIKRIAEILDISYFIEASIVMHIMNFLTFPKTQDMYPSHTQEVTVELQAGMLEKRAKRRRKVPSLCEGITKSDQDSGKQIS